MYQENPQWNGPMSSIKFAVIVEAALESAPQFVIQLYAMAVQQSSGAPNESIVQNHINIALLNVL